MIFSSPIPNAKMIVILPNTFTSSNNVQEALENLFETVDQIQIIINNLDASQIPITTVEGLKATNVQEAIEEIVTRLNNPDFGDVKPLIENEPFSQLILESNSGKEYKLMVDDDGSLLTENN